jgi:hypothetical protein
MPCYGPKLFTSPNDVCGCIIQMQAYDSMGNPVHGFYLPLAPTPGPDFFNIRGIYGQRFGRYQSAFDNLYAIQEYNTILNGVITNPVDYFNNPAISIPIVTNLNFQTQFKYEQQLTLFRKVYAYNLAAYYSMANKNPNGNPIYYRFTSASELSEFKAAMALINKLYNVSFYYPLQCIFFLPFPPFCIDTL